MKHQPLALLSLSLVMAACSLPPAPPPAQAAAAACPVTQPRRVENVRKGVTYDPSYIIGDRTFWTEVSPDNITHVLPFQVEPDGMTRLKWPWIFDEHLEGDFAVEGQRLDVPSPSPVMKNLGGQPNRGYSPDFEPGTGVIFTSMAFPTEGCWQVTATKGRAQLRFVTKVVKVGN